MSQHKRALVGALAVALGLAPVSGWGQSAENQRSNNQGSGQSQKVPGEPIDLANLPSDLERAFLLTPQEREATRKLERKDQNATYKPLNDVKPVKGVVRLNKSSSTIPTIKAVPNYPASVVFTDMTGQPWPIRHVAQTGSVAEVEEVSGSANSLVFYAKNHAGEKSVSVFLKGMELPITLTLKANEQEYHSVKNVQITERGPNSTVRSATTSSGSSNRSQDFGASQESSGEGESLDGALNKMAYRVTPDGYKRVQVSDSKTEAWVKKNDPSQLYLLTPYTIASPAPVNGGDSIMPLGEGMRLYVLPRINPVMALNESGQRLYLKFQE